MRYLPENHFKGGDFPFELAISATAKEVARSCGTYAASLLSPKRSAVETKRAGILPDDAGERDRLIDDCLSWIFQNSHCKSVFRLYLHEKGSKDNPKFAYHDGTCCFELDLTEGEFAALTTAVAARGLPQDLFYPESLAVCVKFNDWFSRILRPFGVQSTRCYTPREWAAKNRQLDDKGRRN